MLHIVQHKYTLSAIAVSYVTTVQSIVESINDFVYAVRMQIMISFTFQKRINPVIFPKMIYKTYLYYKSSQVGYLQNVLGLCLDYNVNYCRYRRN